jgi:hypothetical protein
MKKVDSDRIVLWKSWVLDLAQVADYRSQIRVGPRIVTRLGLPSRPHESRPQGQCGRAGPRRSELRRGGGGSSDSATEMVPRQDPLLANAGA